MHFSLRVALAAAGIAAAVAPASAQMLPLDQALPIRLVPAPKIKFEHKHGTIYFNSNIGSFKLLSNGDVPAEGTLDFTFRGTVLISNMDPNSVLQITGNVRKELDDKANHKVVYFGEGRMTLTGRCRAVQFFGRNVRGVFKGAGVIRTVGEFDKNLDTGRWWYEGDIEKNYWATSVINLAVPKPVIQKPKVIQPKSGG